MNSTLTGPVAAYFEAMNRFDTDALLATFTDDALVNDIQREFGNSASIRRWADKEIIGDKVVAKTFREVRAHHGDVIVTAVMDGEYDKTNLPAELELTFYFSLDGDKIARLIILHNKPGY